VGIVGGIGITPLRSIINNADNLQDQTKITLIYSATEHYTYKAELEDWSNKNPSINVIYTHTPDEVLTELSSLIDTCKDTAHYFISGAPRMIESLQETCLGKKISKSHIISDPFKGY